MVLYRRNLVPGGSYFFTVTLAERGSDRLVRHVGLLREAFRVARRERPFRIDAIVVLPDHLHTVWTLPVEDADYPGRWRRIKADFSRQVAAIDPRLSKIAAANTGSGSAATGSIPCATTRTLPTTSTISTSTRSSTAWSNGCETGGFSFHRYVRAGLLPADWADCQQTPTVRDH